MTQPSREPISSSLTLLVIYTEQLDACRDFYSGLGITLVREQHGDGPVHYAAVLAGGLVLELYPGTPERATGRVRLAFTVPAGPDRPPGQHRYTRIPTAGWWSS